MMLLFRRNLLLPCFLVTLVCSGQNSNVKFSSQQRAALELVAQYVDTADWKLRTEIASLTGFREVLPSRIYRAFDIISLNASPNDDRSVVDAAWEEVGRNPRLSLYLLEPLLREKLSPEDKIRYGGKTYPPVREEHRDLFFQICLTFTDGDDAEFAYSLLQRLATSANPDIAQKATTDLGMAKKPNRGPQSRNHN